MNCPNCNSRMTVTHSYSAGPKAYTKRLECSDEKCGTVATATLIMESVNPGYGEGAAALAKKLRDKPEIVGISD